MTHLKQKTKSELYVILTRCNKNKIPYRLTKCEGKITMIDTKDKELLAYAKKNNPNLI
tara:strand:- start:425 stop:598 length:174 start_codon:yes stop_codon:yes gene_type:complete